MKYFVSRQIYWPDSVHMVEIAIGGIDYANADMLIAKYPGEGKEYNNPIEAVDAGKNVLHSWNLDLQKCKSQEKIYIAAGSTGGFTWPFEAMTDEELDEWAQNEFDKLPKCARCGDLLGNITYSNFEIHWDNEKFCSIYCVEMDIERIEKDANETIK